MTEPEPHGHDYQPPPQESDLVRQVAALLTAGAVGALLTGAILRLLAPFGVGIRAVTLALRLVQRGTQTKPRMIGQAAPVRAQQDEEMYYRAAYLIEAAKRMQATLTANRDLPIDEASQAAIERERRFLAMHEAARKLRMAAAVAVAQVSREVGGVLLGWWASPDDRTTPECRAAGGHNFRVDQRPLIGWPGQPHGGTCRCVAGAPFYDAITVDEATRHLIGRAVV